LLGRFDQVSRGATVTRREITAMISAPAAHWRQSTRVRSHGATLIFKVKGYWTKRQTGRIVASESFKSNHPSIKREGKGLMIGVEFADSDGNETGYRNDVATTVSQRLTLGGASITDCATAGYHPGADGAGTGYS
jgi:hypothetical protein